MIFGTTGLVSPTEMALEIRPYLNIWFEQIGFDLPATAPSFTRQIRKSLYLGLEHEKEERADRAMLLKQVKEAIKPSTSNNYRPSLRRQLVTDTIRLIIPSYEPSIMPHGTVIDEDLALAIRNKAINLADGNLLVAYKLCRELRIRLRSHRNDPGCKITLPPTVRWAVRPPLNITRANIIAADQYAELESRFLEYCRTNHDLDICLVAQCALVMWGDCPSINEAPKWLEIYRNTLLIHKSSFQLIDIGKDLGSRTITGWAHLACLAWMQQGCPQQTARLGSIFGPEISKQDFDCTVRYSRKITLPSVYTDILADQLPHVELPRKRLLDFLHDNIAALSEDTPTDIQPKRKQAPITKQTNTRSLKNQFDDLRSAIPPIKKSNETVLASHATIRNSIAKWKLNESLSPLIMLLTHWAEILLGQHANRKTAEKLSRDTVRTYLYHVWITTISAFPDGDFLDLEADEITEQLAAALPIDQKLAAARTTAINRFFYEISQHYEIPAVSLNSTDTDQRASIEACIITRAENQHVNNQLSQWTQTEDIQTAALLRLKVSGQLTPSNNFSTTALLFSF